MGIELDDETKAAAKIIQQECKKYRDSEKVILVYYGVSFENLCTERGEPFLYKTGDKAADEQFAREDIEGLYDDIAIANRSLRIIHNFRLLDVQFYTAFVLPEHMFREGVILLEDEPDVDKYIRDHNSIASEKWSF